MDGFPTILSLKLQGKVIWPGDRVTRVCRSVYLEKMRVCGQIVDSIEFSRYLSKYYACYVLVDAQCSLWSS